MEISVIKGGGVRCLMANAIKNFHIFFYTYLKTTGEQLFCLEGNSETP